MKYGLMVLVLGLFTAGIGWPQTDQFRSLGFHVEGVGTRDELPEYRLTGPDGLPIRAIAAGPLTEEHLRGLSRLQDIKRSLSSLRLAGVNLVFGSGRVDALLVPSSYVIEEREFAPLLPAGMLFRYDGAVFFDFRLLVDNLAVRINSQFVDPESFENRLIHAADDPLAYIQSQDPTVLSRRIIAQTERLDELIHEVETLSTELQSARVGQVYLASRRLFGRYDVVDPSAVDMIVAAKIDDRSLSVSTALDLVEGMTIEECHVRAIFALYFNEFAVK